MHDYSQVPSMPPCLETLEERLLLSAPGATLTAEDVVWGGNPAHAVVVEYRSDTAIDLKTIDDKDVRVTGPNGYDSVARIVMKQSQEENRVVLAVYRIEAAGGIWDAADNGDYAVQIVQDEVANVAGEAVPAGEIGQFNVSADIVVYADRFEFPDQSIQLGVVEGLVLLPNLNGLDDFADPFVFQLPGAGSSSDFVEISYASNEGSLAMSLYRKVSDRVPKTGARATTSASAKTLYTTQFERVGAGKWTRLSNSTTYTNQGGVVNKRIQLSGQPAGTYMIWITTIDSNDDGRVFASRNPNYTLAVHTDVEKRIDLSGAVDDTDLPPTFIAGDKVSVPVLLTNLGESKVEGQINLAFYLSQDDVLDAGDFLVGEALNVQADMRGGGSRSVRPNIQITNAAPAGTYRLITVIDHGDLLPEVDETNNVIVSDRTFNMSYQFGTFDDRRRQKLTVTDLDGTTAVFSLSGNGSAELVYHDDKAPSLIVTGTDSRSSIKISTKGGDKVFLLSDIVVGDPNDGADATTLRQLTGSGTQLTGTIMPPGRIGVVKLLNVNERHDLTALTTQLVSAFLSISPPQPVAPAALLATEDMVWIGNPAHAVLRDDDKVFRLRVYIRPLRDLHG